MTHSNLIDLYIFPYFFLILIIFLFLNKKKFQFVGKDILLIFFFTTILATVCWGLMTINDDSSEFYEDISSGFYDNMSLFEISINGQNSPLAIWLWIRLYRIFDYLHFGNSPLIGVYFNSLLNVIAYCFYYMLMLAVEKHEQIVYNKKTFFALFIFSGVNLLLGTSHFRDSMLVATIAFYSYFSYKFYIKRTSLPLYSLITFGVIWCVFWLRLSYTIIPFIIFLVSFLKHYWESKVLIGSFLIVATICSIAILTSESFGLLREVSSRSDGIVTDAGLSGILFNANFFVRIILLPVYFFSYPFPITSYFTLARMGDLFGFCNTLFLILIFPATVIRAIAYAREYKKRRSVFFLLGIFIICFYAVLFSSFEFRHAAPFLPLLFIMLSDQSLKGRNLLLSKVISTLWLLLIFIFNMMVILVRG
jgi:hypothetical protein